MFNLPYEMNNTKSKYYSFCAFETIGCLTGDDVYRIFYQNLCTMISCILMWPLSRPHMGHLDMLCMYVGWEQCIEPKNQGGVLANPSSMAKARHPPI